MYAPARCSRSSGRVIGLLLPQLALLGLPLSFAGAQDTTGAAAACDGRIVSAIDVVTRPPTFSVIPGALRGIVRTVGFQATTRASVVRRFLLTEVGRPCSERQRAESERILRLQPYLADASVRAVDDGAGGLRLEVETLDDIPVIVGGRFRGIRPYALTLGNENVAGGGILVAVSGERGFAYRNGATLRVVANQALGRPYTFSLLARRAPLGSTVGIALGHAFLTDLQRSAWHMGFGDDRRYVSFVRPEGEKVAVRTERSFADIGGVTRIGIRGRRAYFGGLLTHERAVQGDEPVVISDSGLVPDADPALLGRFESYENVRINAVIGTRFLRFLPVRGFDALTATQDVATGVQIGLLAGHGFPRLGGTDDDLFLSGDLYVGLASERSLIAMRTVWEGRRDRDAGWDATVGSARLAWYRKMSDSKLFIASGEFSGGWRSRLPFQLTLGDRQGGLRGYHGSRIAGGRRAVLRLEERWVIGRLMGRADVGVAGFMDAGKTWAGDVPFGLTSPVKTSLGLGLLAAAPRSKQLLRADIAVPLSRDSGAPTWELRLSTSITRGFWREPRDVSRLRAGAAPSSIFTWP